MRLIYRRARSCSRRPGSTRYSPFVDMHLGTTPSFRYANGWWAIPEKHALMKVGYKRQLIIVLPDIDIVAVVTGRGPVCAKKCLLSPRAI